MKIEALRALWCRLNDRGERMAYLLMACDVYAWDIGAEVYAEARKLGRDGRRYLAGIEANRDGRG